MRPGNPEQRRQRLRPSADKPPSLRRHYRWCRGADTLLGVHHLCIASWGENSGLKNRLLNILPWSLMKKTAYPPNPPFSLREAQAVGPGESASVLQSGGVGGSLSRICSGTRSWSLMCGGGSRCRLHGLIGDERLYGGWNSVTEEDVE